MAELEDWVGVRILNRSTRRLSLTSAGEIVLSRCREIISIADSISAEMEDQVDEPKGHIKLSCSPFAADQILLPILDEYLASYPKVTLDLHLTNQTVDLIKERVDVAIRITRELDPNLIARKLSNCPSVLCASKDYIEASGIPTELGQLQKHRCLIFSKDSKQCLWHFHRDDEEYSIPIQGTVSASDTSVLLNAVLRGMGISYLPLIGIEQYFRSGELIEILPEYRPIDLGIFCVYRSRNKMPRHLRLLIDTLVQSFRNTGFHSAV